MLLYILAPQSVNQKSSEQLCNLTAGRLCLQNLESGARNVGRMSIFHNAGNQEPMASRISFARASAQRFTSDSCSASTITRAFGSVPE